MKRKNVHIIQILNVRLLTRPKRAKRSRPRHKLAQTMFTEKSCTAQSDMSETPNISRTFRLIIDKFQKIAAGHDLKVFVKLDSANRVNLLGFSSDRLHVFQAKLLYVSMRVFAERFDEFEKRLADIERRITE